MAVDLKVTKEVFTQQMNTLKGYNQDMKESYLSIYREVGKLSGQAWSGAASELYHDKFETLYQNIEQIENVMNNVLNRLQTVLNIVEETEQEASQQFQAAEEGTAYNKL